jgi:hypothetical protein
MSYELFSLFGISLDHKESVKVNTALEYSTRVVHEGGRRCKKSTLNDLVHLTPLRIPLMNPPIVLHTRMYSEEPSSRRLNCTVAKTGQRRSALPPPCLIPFTSFIHGYTVPWVFHLVGKAVMHTLERRKTAGRKIRLLVFTQSSKFCTLLFSVFTLLCAQSPSSSPPFVLQM